MTESRLEQRNASSFSFARPPNLARHHRLVASQRCSFATPLIVTLKVPLRKSVIPASAEEAEVDKACGPRRMGRSTERIACGSLLSG